MSSILTSSQERRDQKKSAVSRATPVTLRQGILEQKNSLNLIRLLLAVVVIIGHAPRIVVGENLYNLQSLGDLAVNFFFCISGFLILASAQRNSLQGYIWRRVLRIYPAYIASIFLVILFASPITKMKGLGSWSLSEAVSYFVQNIDLMRLQWGFGGGPADIPVPSVWNGSAWTLGYEFLAYLLLIPVVFLPIVKKHQKWVITVAFVLSLFMYPLLAFKDSEIGMYWRLARLLPFFLAGSLLYVWSDKILAKKAVMVSSGVIAFVAFFATGFEHSDRGPVFAQLTQIFFAYFILTLSVFVKVQWGVKTDLSYGMYVYAHIIQQLLMVLGLGFLGVAGNIFLAIVITGVLAYLSWTFIEKPAMQLKKLMK